MQSSKLMNLAGAVIALALGVAGWMFIPGKAWNVATTAAYVVLLITVGLTLSPTFGLPRSAGRSDAKTMAFIGPTAVFSLLQLALAGSAVASAFAGLANVTVALLLVWVAGGGAMLLYVQAGVHVVNNAGADLEEDRVRFTWKQQLDLVQAQEGCKDVELRRAANELMQVVEYAPSSRGQLTTTQDTHISQLLQDLIALDGHKSAMQVTATFNKLRGLLQERQALLLGPR